MAIPVPLTRKQLTEVVGCYATVFPDWRIVKGQVFARADGPVVQHVGFEALRSGAYRPWSGIGCLALPDVHMLHRFLDIKHREITLREHPRKWKAVVTAMEQQFRPAIREPLSLHEVKRLCEQGARESTNDLCMLAILSTYLGEMEQALACCARMQTVPPPTLAPRLDWERRHREFGVQLGEAIAAGNGRQFLDAASALT